MKKRVLALLLVLTLLLGTLSGCELNDGIAILDDVLEMLDILGGSDSDSGSREPSVPTATEFDADEFPAYSTDAYVVINDNQPFFDLNEVTSASVEYYSPLDELGRCGMTYACIGQDLMPTEKRGDISSVKPTGWEQKKYDFVDGKSLYNRCHLIGHQLAGEDANKENLVTGTRYLNVEGMLPFENITADYVKETGNHVAYRVTPVFKGKELVCRGVVMEAYSVEDEGEGVCFCVYAFNVQPGVSIDYKTGKNKLAK